MQVNQAEIASINSRVPAPSWRAGSTSLVKESFSEVFIQFNTRASNSNHICPRCSPTEWGSCPQLTLRGAEAKRLRGISSRRWKKKQLGCSPAKEGIWRTSSVLVVAPSETFTTTWKSLPSREEQQRERCIARMSGTKAFAQRALLLQWLPLLRLAPRERERAKLDSQVKHPLVLANRTFSTVASTPSDWLAAMVANLSITCSGCWGESWRWLGIGLMWTAARGGRCRRTQVWGRVTPADLAPDGAGTRAIQLWCWKAWLLLGTSTLRGTSRTSSWTGMRLSRQWKLPRIFSSTQKVSSCQTSAKIGIWDTTATTNGMSYDR